MCKERAVEPLSLLTAALLTAATLQEVALIYRTLILIYRDEISANQRFPTAAVLLDPLSSSMMIMSLIFKVSELYNLYVVARFLGG